MRRVENRQTVTMDPTDSPRSLRIAWITTLGLAAAAAVATGLANVVILRLFPDAARPDDLLFELLPYVESARWLTVIPLFAGPAVFLLETIRTAPRRLPAVGSAVAIMYLLRAGMIVLTPLAPAHGEGGFVFTQVQYGMFPSGHTALVTLLALLTPDEPAWLRRFMWSMVVLMIVGMVLAHGHYSIDIVGGLLLAYFVATVWRHGRLFTPVARLTGR